MSKLFSALRGLGFREAEVRAVIGERRGREELHGAPIQDWLRAVDAGPGGERERVSGVWCANSGARMSHWG